ncbi:hypothetical protein QQX98_005379 [Neonectria punicea]|uniref:Uncharacterized protein n=1 Tax=Neonectria punicea TaxID=979145 RepID=A0ABR1H5D1_9HYPO
MALFIRGGHRLLLDALISKLTHDEVLENYGRAMARGSIFIPSVVITSSNCDCAKARHGVQADICHSARTGSMRPIANGPIFTDLVFLTAAWYGARGSLDKLHNQSRVWYNGRTSTGKTALHLAAEAGYVGITKLLLDEGWDSKNSSGVGKTPLNLAMDRSNTAVMKVLMEAEQNKPHVKNPRPSRQRLGLFSGNPTDENKQREQLLDLAEVFQGRRGHECEREKSSLQRCRIY